MVEGSPAGPSRGRPLPVELDEERCKERLRGGVMGRVGYTTPEGPRILPLNYSVVEETIVFRTAPDTELAKHAPGSTIAFEVDHFDHVRSQGWSVLATGRCEAVTDGEEIEWMQRVWGPRPWAGGARPLHLRLPWTRLTGRRVGDDGTWYDEHLPPTDHDPRA